MEPPLARYRHAFKSRPKPRFGGQGKTAPPPITGNFAEVLLCGWRGAKPFNSVAAGHKRHNGAVLLL